MELLPCYQKFAGAMIQMKIRNIFIGLLLNFLAYHTAMALPEDKNLPLQVVADTVAVNYAKGITTMQGHVTVTQGTTKLQGSTVVVFTDKQQKLIKLIAYGNEQQQAHYQTLPAKNSSLFTATANIITYMNLEKLAIFDGDAHANDGINQFQGPNFKYWTEKQEVVTEKVANQQSTITIFPGSGSSK